MSDSIEPTEDTATSDSVPTTAVPAAPVDTSVCTVHDGRSCPQPVGFFVVADDGVTITGAACLIGKQYRPPANIKNTRCGACGKALPTDVYAGPTCPACNDVVQQGGSLTPVAGLTGRARFKDSTTSRTAAERSTPTAPADDWQETLEDVVRLRGLSTGDARVLATKVLVDVARRS